jgi:phosphoglucosamine mutase
LQELGAEVIAMGVSPDGLNINQDCGSTHTKALQKQVLETGAHLGIAFDGDGDRLMLVDHQGHEVNGDQILYILAKWYQAQGQLKGAVVGTLMSNYGLEIAFKTLGIPFDRVAVGDRHILQRLEEQQGVLGGESSGHIICLDSSSTGDGLICALKILMVMIQTQQSLYDLTQNLILYPQMLINVPLSARLQSLDRPQIHQAVQWAEERLNGQGRVLLRPSGTEPLVRVMVEGQDHSLVCELAEGLAEAVQLAVES